MDEAALVCVVDRPRQRFDERDGLRARYRRAVHTLGEAAPLNQLHAQVGAALMLADLVNGNDLRMVHLGGRLRLVVKALQFGGRGEPAREDHLQGDETVEALLAGLVDDAHAPAGDLLQQLIITEFMNHAGGWVHGGRGAREGGRDRRVLIRWRAVGPPESAPEKPAIRRWRW